MMLIFMKKTPTHTDSEINFRELALFHGAKHFFADRSYIRSNQKVVSLIFFK